MSSPLISVIVPIFNTEPYLCRAIDSILAQTHKNLEVLLINDGSTDGSGRICDEYAIRDSRIRVIHQENSGVSMARNAGLDVATGGWIGFVDSDDWVEPEMYEKLLRVAASKKVTIVACGFIKHCEEGWKEIRKFDDFEGVISTNDALGYVLDGRYFEGFLWNKLFNSKMIKNADISFGSAYETCQDLVFVVQSILKGGVIAGLSEPLYHYCLRKGSKTQSFNDKRLTELVARKEVIALTSSITECHTIAKNNYVTAAVCLMRDAVVASKFEYLPNLKTEARKYLRGFILSANYDLRLKLRALAIIFFPKTSFKVWMFAKKRLGVTWWYKEMERN